MKSGTSLRVLSGIFPISALLLGLPATWAMNTTEDRIDRSFPATPGGRLVVDADRGSIDVTTAGNDKIQVEVTRKVRSMSEQKAKRLLAEHQISFSQDGKTLKVTGKGPRFGSLWDKTWNYLHVHYQISVPRDFNVQLKTAGGNISVGDLKGEVKAQSSGGSLTLGTIDGPVTLKTSGGSIKVGGASRELRAESSGGAIHIGKSSAKVLAQTSGGNIEVREAVGPVQATTSGGSVSVTFSAPPKENSSLVTSGGGVTAALPPAANLQVDAHTSGGRVRTDLPITIHGKPERNTLRGQLNNGGKLLTLRTSGGNIYLKRNNRPAVPSQAAEKAEEEK